MTSSNTLQDDDLVPDSEKPTSLGYFLFIEISDEGGGSNEIALEIIEKLTVEELNEFPVIFPPIKGILHERTHYNVLHQAVRTGRVPVIQALIRKGVDLNIITEQSLTCVMLAISIRNTPIQDKLEIIKMLHVAGSDINARTEFKSTLHYALTNAHLNNYALDIIEYLLLHGADPNEVCMGITSLFTIVNWPVEERCKVLQLLIDYDVDLYKKNRNGRGFLHYTSFELKIMVLLLKNDWDFEKCDLEGESILDTRCQSAFPYTAGYENYDKLLKQVKLVRLLYELKIRIHRNIPIFDEEGNYIE